MKANQEHLDNLDFVARYKEANKNTTFKTVYDPVKKLRILVPIEIDPNAYQFAKENVITESDLKNRRRREKAKSNNIAKPPSPPKPAKEPPKPRQESAGAAKKPKGELRQNVIRLRNAGYKFMEIGKMYGVKDVTAKMAYYRETEEIKKNESQNRNRPGNAVPGTQVSFG
ncbi:MAG: hypothetical protein E2590_12705 [Chryseobacterium sp.]|nr:hypothetical protein [Chryseobacterium sp.]